MKRALHRRKPVVALTLSVAFVATFLNDGPGLPASPAPTEVRNLPPDDVWQNLPRY